MRALIDGDDTVAVIPPAPGDVEAELAERAARAFGEGEHRTMTLVGGFDLAALRATVDHEPFPLVRRLARRGWAQ